MIPRRVRCFARHGRMELRSVLGRETDYELQETDSGFWVPKTIRRVNLFDSTIWETRISDVKVNMAMPPEAFQVIFPPWASITDSRKQVPE